MPLLFRIACFQNEPYMYLSWKLEKTLWEAWDANQIYANEQHLTFSTRFDAIMVPLG